MRLPKQIKVRDTLWRVKLCDMEDFGSCHWQSRTILIRKGLDAKTRKQTFIHELLHACEFSYGDDLGHRWINKLEVWLSEIEFD